MSIHQKCAPSLRIYFSINCPSEGRGRIFSTALKSHVKNSRRAKWLRTFPWTTAWFDIPTFHVYVEFLRNRTQRRVWFMNTTRSSRTISGHHWLELNVRRERREWVIDQSADDVSLCIKWKYNFVVNSASDERPKEANQRDTHTKCS